MNDIDHSQDEKAMPKAWTLHRPGDSMVQRAANAFEIGVQVAMHAAQSTEVRLNGSSFMVRSVPTVQAVQPIVKIV